MIRTLLLLATLTFTLQAAGPGIVFEGGKGPGKGKHIVLLAGDHEYRSEEALPQLARILATRHGFKCTVLFAVTLTTLLSVPVPPVTLIVPDIVMM